MAIQMDGPARRGRARVPGVSQRWRCEPVRLAPVQFGVAALGVVAGVEVQLATLLGRQQHVAALACAVSSQGEGGGG